MPRLWSLIGMVSSGALPEDVKERQETVNARHTRQNEFLNEYVERLPTDGPLDLGRSDGGVGSG